MALQLVPRMKRGVPSRHPESDAHHFAGCTRQVPKPALYGVFLYMGITSIPGNEIFERIYLWTIWDSTYYPGYRYVGTIKHCRMHAYTLLQAPPITRAKSVTCRREADRREENSQECAPLLPAIRASAR